MKQRESIEKEEQKTINIVCKTFQSSLSEVYPFIFNRIAFSNLSPEQKEAAFAHSFSLLKKYILYYGDNITDADPFKYLDSIGC